MGTPPASRGALQVMQAPCQARRARHGPALPGLWATARGAALPGLVGRRPMAGASGSGDRAGGSRETSFDLNYLMLTRLSQPSLEIIDFFEP